MLYVPSLHVCLCVLVSTPSSTSVDPMANGISTSVESIDESPEDGSTAKHSAPSTPSAHHAHSGQSETRPSGVGGSAHHSPLPSRFTPKGHRRTGSDPFAFRPAQLAVGRGFSRGHTPHFTIGTSNPPDLSQVDLKGEAVTFKATTAAIISSLSHCLDALQKREDYWQKKFDKVRGDQGACG